jgi:glycosyltransferase involved in cell wall biosynthesis
MEKISVLIPSFNRADYLPETITSVLRQSYQEFEIVVLDDGSTDATPEIMASFTDPRIHYHRRQRTGLLPRLRNQLAELSTGSFLAFLDSDDLWHEKKLEMCITACKTERAEVCLSDCVEFTTQGPSPKTAGASLRQQSHVDLKKEILINNVTLTYGSNIFTSRKLFKQLNGFDENMFHGDHDFVCRALWHGKNCYVREPLNLIRRHDKNMSSINLNDERPYEEYNTTILKLLGSGLILMSEVAHIITKNNYLAALSIAHKKGNLSGLGYLFDKTKTKISFNEIRYMAKLKFPSTTCNTWLNF